MLKRNDIQAAYRNTDDSIWRWLCILCVLISFGGHIFVIQYWHIDSGTPSVSQSKPIIVTLVTKKIQPSLSKIITRSKSAVRISSAQHSSESQISISKSRQHTKSYEKKTIPSEKKAVSNASSQGTDFVTVSRQTESLIKKSDSFPMATESVPASDSLSDKTAVQSNALPMRGAALTAHALELARTSGAQILGKELSTGTDIVKVGQSGCDYQCRQYAEDWRQKVERLGNANYPQAAVVNELHGRVLVRVVIGKTGNIQQLGIVRSSGKAILDEAALRIIRMGAPYSPLPDSVSNHYRALEIRRYWVFLPGSVFAGK